MSTSTTTNYGWTIPNDDELVKNGAAAIRTLGQAIDTTAAASFAPGLIHINTTTFSAVSAQNLQYFSSNYDNYKIILNFTASSANAMIRYRMSASGVDATTTDYNTGLRYIRSTGSGGDTQGNNSNYGILGYIASGNPEDTRITFDIISPFLAERTGLTINGPGYDTVSWLTYVGSSAYRVSTSYNGITIYPSTGTLSGTATIFGYRKS